MEKFEQINTLNTLDEKDKVIERLKNELENTNLRLFAWPKFWQLNPALCVENKLVLWTS